MTKIFIALCLLGLSLFSKELLEDPSFKKFEKNWNFKKKSEYNYIKKPIIRRGVLSIETKHTGEAPYIYITTEAPIKAQTEYTLTINVKGSGTGTMKAGIRTTVKPKEAIRNINLGLKATLTPEKEWKTHKINFTSKSDFTDKNKPQLLLAFGSYEGKIEIKELSLTKK